MTPKPGARLGPAVCNSAQPVPGEGHKLVSMSITSSRPRKPALGALALLVAVGAAACASVTINKVLSDPGRYRDNEVSVSGEVADSFSVGSRGAYRLKDGSGQLWVVSEHGVPRNGARVVAKGKIREGFNLSGLGDRLPAGLGAGLVLVESSHKAK
jgi:hypothetical protein